MTQPKSCPDFIEDHYRQLWRRSVAVDSWQQSICRRRFGPWERHWLRGVRVVARDYRVKPSRPWVRKFCQFSRERD